MIPNYEKDRNGVIRQMTREHLTAYDQQYVQERYSSAPVQEMSNLRLGYIVGSIGYVPDSILDIGYGQGDFLRAAAKLVPHVRGYDVPPAYPVPGIELVESPYAQCYDVVTFFDSLEHFESIYDIKALRARNVVLSVPWCHYLSDDWFRTWKHRRPNEHLWHFDLDSLTRFMGEVGYSIVNHCAIEDAIRRGDGIHANILTATFRSKKN